MSEDMPILHGKIRKLSPYAIDKTLSVEGASADAQAVGNALNEKLDRTWVADNLTTDDPEKALSAKQGKVLKKSIDDFKSEMTLATENAQSTADDAKSTAKSAQQTADNAQTAAEEALAEAENAMKANDNALLKAGGAMTGTLSMGGFKVISLADPVEEEDAVNKKYVDGKRKVFTASLLVSGWTTEAPFKQTLVMEDILESDNPHISPVYSDTLETALTQKEAWAMVCDAETADETITFTCFEEVPEVEIPIQIEVIR